MANWDESKHPRGKTTEASTPGSFKAGGLRLGDRFTIWPEERAWPHGLKQTFTVATKPINRKRSQLPDTPGIQFKASVSAKPGGNLHTMLIPVSNSVKLVRRGKKV